MIPIINNNSLGAVIINFIFFVTIVKIAVHYELKNYGIIKNKRK